MEIAVKTENNTPTRSTTNGDTTILGHNKNVKQEKLGEAPSTVNREDQKWKSNSLTKTRTTQMSNNSSNTNLYRNNSQRISSSEHSSPQAERRNDQTSARFFNGGLNNFLEANCATNVNGKTTSDTKLEMDDYNIHPQENIPKVVTSSIQQNLDEKCKDKKPSSEFNVSEFAQVSEDMNELVYHLHSIQNDISELAGKSISLCENQT